MLIPKIRYMHYHIFHINHQKYLSGRNPALKRRCYAKLIKKKGLGKVKFKFVLIFTNYKNYSPIPSQKNSPGPLVFERCHSDSVANWAATAGPQCHTVGSRSLNK